MLSIFSPLFEIDDVCDFLYGVAVEIGVALSFTSSATDQGRLDVNRTFTAYIPC